MNIRRYYVPNAIIFITQVVDRRVPVFREETHLDLLREILGNVKELHPFVTQGYVFLHEHFHLLIRPTGDSNFSDIMHSLKPNFTKEYKKRIGTSGPMHFWQKGFWDHIIRDEIDFQRHLDYIHYNPVHHGLVARPEDWPHSSYHHWRERNAYPDGWGWALPESITEYDWQESEDDNP
ncbi:MAG: transposase [Caldilineaceae bacterium]|nr:transposase [Caldilineaceae bacterium]